MESSSEHLFSSNALSSLVNRIKRGVSEEGNWTPAVIGSAGEVSHKGETITEEELAQRWEESGRAGLKAIDFRPPE
ncbi:hypothetical protein [Salinibacter altiplanensis]|uniref:hypothetical protein n=1 Tax=Salinibacter altiplanensis TaxID=1803181 RepID=UPI000C9EF927|nr:hypothetical protein [Salinibacter altiplanensis]